MPAVIEVHGEEVWDKSENGEELSTWAMLVDKVCDGYPEAFPYALWLEHSFSGEDKAHRNSAHWGTREENGLPYRPGVQCLNWEEWMQSQSRAILVQEAGLYQERFLCNIHGRLLRLDERKPVDHRRYPGDAPDEPRQASHSSTWSMECRRQRGEYRRCRRPPG